MMMEKSTKENDESDATSSISLLDERTTQTDSNIVLPGDCLLRHEPNIIASNGTYLKNGYVYASKAGRLEIEACRELSALAEESDRRASIDTPPSSSSSSSAIIKRVVRVRHPATANVPFLEPGSTVTVRILRTSSTFAKCAINCIEDHVLKQAYSGIIRADDIREYDREKVNIGKCFRPGDVVLARVIAYGENQYLLTTAAPELGVVIATNDWAEPMIPISANEVLCPRTYTKEARKVAKIDLI